MASIAKFCERMTYWADEGNLGYDQSNRWDIRYGGECDCSSLVIFALREAGFDTGSASYTGDMSANLTKRGWKRITANIANCQPGDILLNDSYHVAVVVKGYGWDATIAQASIDERGRATGGQAGDQSGRETNTRKVYTYSRGWDCILRYSGTTTIQEPTPKPTTGKTSAKLDVDGEWGKKTTSTLQSALGTEADGIVSGQLVSCKRYMIADAGSWVWNNGTGSDVIAALQGKLHTAADGWFGRDTSSALQRKLGVTVDGVTGAETTKALQRALNSGTVGKW